MHRVTYLKTIFEGIECHIVDNEYLTEILANLRHIVFEVYSLYKNKTHANDGYLSGIEVLFLPPAEFTICNSILLTCTLEPFVLPSITVFDETHVSKCKFICKINAKRATAEDLLTGATR